MSPRPVEWTVAPNAPIPEGTECIVVRDNGSLLQTVTQSAPWSLGGQMVIKVAGMPANLAGYSLRRVYVRGGQ